jgi:hypothetical protein
LSEGAECFIGDYECEEGLTCSGVAGTTQHCAVPGGAGDPCAGDCEPGLVCRYGMGTPVCGIQRSEEEMCGVDNGSVGYATPLGECGPGLNCSYPEFRCEPIPDIPADRRAPGESCVRSGSIDMTCGVGTDCINGRCEVRRRAGEPCEADSECATSACDGNVCSDALHNLGCEGTQ